MSDIQQEYVAAVAQLTGAGGPFELAGDASSGRYYANAPANLAEALREHPEAVAFVRSRIPDL